MESISLYVHIPFCVSKCSYCDFISHRVSDFEKTGGVLRYMNALKEELNLYKDKLNQYQIQTIYVGGGTPSSIDGTYIHDLINHIKTVANVAKDVEMTIEINPGTLTEDKLNHYKSAGFNRVSMGLQTTNDSLLTSIGRIHSTNDFLTTYEAVKNSGIDNISLDLMFGLPAQTLDDIKSAIALIRTLKPKHVSAYSLKLEEGTPLFNAYVQGKVELPDEAVEREMYHLIETGLSALEINQYELSNFALTGYESKHNLVYWKNKPYLGIGVSAHSKLENTRFSNTNAIHAYIESLEKNALPVIDTDEIDEKEDLFETIILGLRLNQGIRIEEINKQYQIDFNTRYKEVLETLLKSELIKIVEDHVILTKLGRDLANQVFVEFMID